MPLIHCVKEIPSLRFLEKSLIQRLAEELPGSFRPSPHQSFQSDRWLLASSLQKCIRRGLLEDAADIAIALFSADKEYAWRRLRVIAVEDIGLGDIHLVATVIAVAGKRRVRDSLDDLQLFVWLVQSLAAAMKDRTACDLLCWSEFSPQVANARAKLLKLPLRWEPLALDDCAPMWQRMTALQLLAGFSVRTHAGYRMLSRVNSEAVRRVVEALQLPPKVAFATLKGSGTELLNVALPFAYLLREAAHVRPIHLAEPGLQAQPRIGGFIAPSFCKHTRVGLRSLRMLLRRDAGLRGMLSQSGATDAAKALGLALFQVESGLLDRVEDYAPKIRIEAERAELAHFGMTDDAACAALRMLLIERLPALNEARKTAWAEYLAEAKSSGELA
ncbi:hypothetical protein [Rhodanobacter denitrificans]|uniref:hypothetical protein n=1 Tax=Rhodanobacter denitrificans TaxID=666685 RepID=UPI001F46D078|nr:hypothetical protein [Rhodanobacter denitrificans]UJJ57095.1 hypothetical protein LRK55_10455 [Rhodanobacter denitrificans]